MKTSSSVRLQQHVTYTDWVQNEICAAAVDAILFPVVSGRRTDRIPRMLRLDRQFSVGSPNRDASGTAAAYVYRCSLTGALCTALCARHAQRVHAHGTNSTRRARLGIVIFRKQRFVAHDHEFHVRNAKTAAPSEPRGDPPKTVTHSVRGSFCLFFFLFLTLTFVKRSRIRVLGAHKPRVARRAFDSTRTFLLYTCKIIRFFTYITVVYGLEFTINIRVGYINTRVSIRTYLTNAFYAIFSN